MPSKPLGERVVALETVVTELVADVADLKREIDGPGTPDRPPIRRRLHQVEGALDAMLALVKQRTEEREQRFKRWHAIAGLTLAFWGAVVAPTMTLYFTLRHGR